VRVLARHTRQRPGHAGRAGRAVQVADLREILAGAVHEPRLIGLLGLDKTAGHALLALGVGGLFVSGMAEAASVLAASLAVTAAGNAWDASPAEEAGGGAGGAHAGAGVGAGGVGH
jgi:hypothetical protein